jgi:hypothetical protein
MLVRLFRTFQPFLMFLALGLLASAAVYWPTIGYGFAYDDYYLVRPHTSADVMRAFAGSWYPHDVMVPFYRPLTVAFHAARFALFHFDPRPYHGLSLLLFGVIAALVGWLTRRVVGLTTAGVFAIAATAVHPSLPYALVAWTTNQMHLLQSIVVLTAIVWWHAHRARGVVVGWLPLLGFAVVAFLIKEDGVMLLPCIIALEVLYARIVERRWAIPPVAFLVAAVVAVAALIWLRAWALHGLGGYGAKAPNVETMQRNFAQGLSRALLYQPFDRPGKAFVGWAVIAITVAGLIATFARDLRAMRFLLLAGLTIAIAFNVPFVFVTKREQLYLISLGGAIAFAAACAALWMISRQRWWRALFAVTLAAIIITSANIARLMAADFAPYDPITLGTDEYAAGWASVAPELREFLARKRDLWRQRHQTVQLPDDLDEVTYGAHGWEAEPSGQRFEWSSGDVTIFVRRTATMITLPVRAFPHPSRQVTITMSVDGRQQPPVTLTSTDWRSVSLWLKPLRLPWRMHVVRLRIEPTWVPAKLDPRSGDQRELGVKLGAPAIAPPAAPRAD